VVSNDLCPQGLDIWLIYVECFSQDLDQVERIHCFKEAEPGSKLDVFRELADLHEELNGVMLGLHVMVGPHLLEKFH